MKLFGEKKQTGPVFRVERLSSEGRLTGEMRVIDQYTLGEGDAVKITVAETGGKGYYFVDEPPWPRRRSARPGKCQTGSQPR